WRRLSGCGGAWRPGGWGSRWDRSPRMPRWGSSSGSTASSVEPGRSVSSCSGAGHSCGSWPSARRFEKRSLRWAERSVRYRLPPGLHLLDESLRQTGPVGGALQGSSQIGMERRDGRIDLDRAGERPEGFLELTLADVHLGQVVHRPGVTLVQHDRLLVRFDRTARVAELALDPAEQAVSLVRRGIDRHDPLDVGKRFLRLALLDQHPAQVQAALHVGRILL